MSRLGLVIASVLWASAARADYMDHFVIRDDVGAHKSPSFGDAKLVLIPVDVAGYPPLNRARLESFFSAGEESGFVRYYETASLGRFRPQVTITPTVSFAQCPLPADKFPGCFVARGDINALIAGQDMLREVVRRVDATGFDFSQHDVNGRRGTADGWVDGVLVITNMPFAGVAFPFTYFNRADNLAGGTGGPLIVDGVKFGHFAIAGDSAHLVLVHEFGHLLGLTDLYDESQQYQGLFLSWMGTWSYDANIPLPDAETRYRLRWGDWHQVQGRQRVTIRPAETSGDVYRLGTGNEYFLVENRGRGVVFDQSLPARGLAVFHVDRTVKLGGAEGDFVTRILSCVNCDPWHPYIRLLQADGRFEIEDNGWFETKDLFRDGNSIRSDDTGRSRSATIRTDSLNWYSGASSGLAIEEIVVNADQTITVTLQVPDADQCGDRLCAEGDGCAPVTCETPPPSAKPGCSVGDPTLVLPCLSAWLLLEQRLRRRKQRVARGA